MFNFTTVVFDGTSPTFYFTNTSGWNTSISNLLGVLSYVLLKGSKCVCRVRDRAAGNGNVSSELTGQNLLEATKRFEPRTPPKPEACQVHKIMKPEQNWIFR